MWALITGVTAGIGEATAFSLAQAGYNIIGLGRRTDRLKSLSEKIATKTNGTIQVKCFSLDVRDKKAVAQFVQEQADLISKVEVLVNNAGLAKGTDKIQEAKVEDWEDMINTNVMGLLYLTRGVLPFLIQNQRGHVVNIGSVAGRWTYPGGGVYCATKFAVRALSEGLRFDLMGTSIRVTNIEPGMAETEFSVVRLGDQTKADKVYENMQPLKAEDIAETVRWCVQRPPHVNIQELVIFPTAQPAVGYVHRGPLPTGR